MQTDLDRIDPATLQTVLDRVRFPEAFVASCYSPAELMERLNIEDEGTFWLAYKAGRIPRGVSLPTDKPFLCWDREIIEEWIRHGCPPDPLHLAHEQIVLQRLLDTVRDLLSAHPPTATERN